MGCNEGIDIQIGEQMGRDCEERDHVEGCFLCEGMIGIWFTKVFLCNAASNSKVVEMDVTRDSLQLTVQGQMSGGHCNENGHGGVGISHPL